MRVQLSCSLLRAAARPSAHETCQQCSSALFRRSLQSSRRQQAQHAAATASTSTPRDAKDKAFAKTLLLPQTDFPLRADAANREKIFRNRTTESLYHWQWNQKERPLFVLHDGPPYANGNLHMGHALNKILKDIIIRYKVLRGYRVHYMPGWDCHGLPIEHKALQQLEADHRKMEPIEIRKIARKTAEKAIKVQMKEFKDFAILADWKNVYKTFDRSYEIRQLRVFREMLRKGLIYRQEKPVLWSPSSKTALAEAEITYKDDHVSKSVFVKFRISQKSRELEQLCEEFYDFRRAPLYLAVWTTTPWTLPGNMFVSYGSDIEYCVTRCLDSYLILATARLAALSEVVGEELEPLVTFEGDVLAGTFYNPPFITEPAVITGLPLHPAPYVTADSGTGLVHSAPAHGMEDYASWLSHPVPAGENRPSMVSLVDADGLFSPAVMAEVWHPLALDLIGQSVLGSGVDKIIEHLEKLKLLLGVSEIKHKYPYDWKTKQPVIIRSTAQWFADVADIKEQAVSSLRSVKFVPEQGRNRLESFVKSRSEWCISRQRSWGVPIPVMFNLETRAPELDDDVIEHTIAALEREGLDHWWNGPIEDFLPNWLKEAAYIYQRGQDTMDVWFDSGTSWSGVQEALKLDGTADRQPVADVYLEGSDQHRGWFQSSLLTSIAVNDAAPFANVITHGFVLDKEGVKMSKSDGNVISPITVIQGGENKAKEPAYGADVLRFWAASAGYTKDVTCSLDTIAGSAEMLRKIRNTIRFILGNLRHGIDASQTSYNLNFVDSHVLRELAKLDQSVREAYDGFVFNRGLAAVSQYCSAVLSSFYFEIVKDSLYGDSLTSERRQAIAFTLSQVLRVLTSCIAPIAPHLAEDAWSHWPTYPRSEATSFFETSWPVLDLPQLGDVSDAVVEGVLTLRKEAMGVIEQARRDGHIGNSVQAGLTLELGEGISSSLRAFLLEHAEHLPAFFVVSNVDLISSGNANSESQMRLFATSMVDLGVQGQVKVDCRAAHLHKCPRCWLHTRHSSDTMCRRCEIVVEAKA